MGTFGASFWNRWSKPFRFIYDLDKLAKDQHLTLLREMTLAFWRWWEDWEQQQQQTRWTEAKVITTPPQQEHTFHGSRYGFYFVHCSIPRFENPS